MLSNNEIRDVRLWLLAYDVTSYKPSKSAIAKLSADEVNTFQRCSDRRQKEYLLGRLLLRFAIQQQLNISTDTLSVIEREALPPHIPLAEEHNLRFSISHSHQLIGVAMAQFYDETKNFNIGLDIEYVKPVRDFATTDFFCNLEQQQAIDGLINPYEKTSLYYLYWTQKEAYLKALQKGITDVALKTIKFSALPTTKDADLFSTEYVLKKEAGDIARYQISVYGSEAYRLNAYSVMLDEQNYSGQGLKQQILNKQVQKLSLSWQPFVLQAS